ncbi:pseudouridine synthase [Pedobacter zeae]|uniref:Pseudouridine synthase n=1 Tax=Pedobacter zeae TaxID=1737356 RepID=A0A7W6P7B4_9SPHI|nr:pseudouridine synthase [Pedobacter zeae]MBB4108774.1 23S rRNA pseudouridine2605 synthase [Pedobacter zeae]GGH08258.1 pseudouridine synthase [Pedobacter zeae]
MINKNNRNSRDDKSKPGSRRTEGKSSSAGTDRKRSGDKDNKFKKSSDSQESFRPRSTDGKDFRSKSFGDKKDFKPRSGGRDFKSKDSEPKGFKFGDREFKSKDSADDRGFKPRDYKSKSGGRDFKARESGRDYKPRTGERDFRSKDGDSRDFKPREGGYKDYKSRGKSDFRPSAGSSRDVKPREQKDGDTRPFRKREELKQRDTEFNRPQRTVVAPARKTNEDKGLIRLNRYISNAGICSRRKADELITAGIITVNGEAVTELGYKVDPAKDLVRYNGELLKREKKVYVLLNKPKDYITTTDDPQERRTVMQLVEKASRERIYPVGRLDRNTTGLLLMTNDGDLADKLSHPKNGITKIYNVELNKALSQGDLNKIAFGLELEDGLIKPDNISYVAGGTKKEIGIQIHSGKNRIVRRIFEHLGYNVEKLDRVVYGNLTKKDLPRGRWRYLEEHELVQIKHLIK